MHHRYRQCPAVPLVSFERVSMNVFFDSTAKLSLYKKDSQAMLSGCVARCRHSAKNVCSLIHNTRVLCCGWVYGSHHATLHFVAFGQTTKSQGDTDHARV